MQRTYNICVCPHVRPSQVNMMFYSVITERMSSFVGMGTHQTSNKYFIVRRVFFCVSFFNERVFLKSTKKGREVFRTCKLHTLLAVESRQNNYKTEKVDIIGTISDVFAEVKRQLRDFLIHTYVERKQDAYMATLISKCDGENVVLQVDFSENATIASQNETQPADWCHDQATHFTVYAWIKEDENESFVIVSDDLTHTKYSVYISMEYIMKHLREKFPSIRVLNVFSDGAGSQFK